VTSGFPAIAFHLRLRDGRPILIANHTIPHNAGKVKGDLFVLLLISSIKLKF
jgi:hypothetical protein